jgi:DNA polymerase-3 subunit delta
VLVLVCAKVDKRIKLFATAKKRGYLHELAPPKNVEAWLRGEASRRGTNIRPAALTRLADAVGSDLSRLSLSLEQLALYAGDRAVEVDDVEDLIADTRERTVFELTDAIGAGDLRRALGTVASLFEQRQSPIGLVIMLARQLRQLGLCHVAIGRRLPRGETARLVGVPPFIVDKLLAQARRYRPRAVAEGLIRLSEADRALKGQAPMMKTLGRAAGERVILEQLVTELIALRR